MCGISGFFSKSNLNPELERSLDLISHRGPDSRGSMTWQPENGCTISLGHVRLSILDASPSGDQPMLSSDGKVAMVFNGEIYNHHLLRERLCGHNFKSHSDSEVLLEYYARFGVDGFKDLRGMFAAAFIHIDSGKLIIVRDQLGIKPVYYNVDSGGIYFSSEIKGISPFVDSAFTVSRDDLFEFLNCGFVYEPNTGLSGVYKVPAGCFLEFNGSSDHSINRYFSLDDGVRSLVFEESEIQRAIERQLEADVKLGVFFSGGLDSSVIAASAKRDNIFVAYNDVEIAESGNANDEPYAQDISKALGLKLETVRIDSEKEDAEFILKTMRNVAEGTEELISDYTFAASESLARAARAGGYKVMLSGMGGDELFIGYPRYRLLFGSLVFKFAFWILNVPFVHKLALHVPTVAKKVDRFVAFYAERRFAIAYARLIGYLSEPELRGLWHGGDYDLMLDRFNRRCDDLLANFADDVPLIKAMVLDYHGFLSHNLMVADKSSMRASLEVRVPLLDQDLFCSFFGALRSERGLRRYGKLKLKEFLYKLLPKALVDRRKTGFNPPLDRKIKVIGRQRILDELRNSQLGCYINIEFAEGVVDEHFSGKRNNTYKIWQLLYLAYWLDNLKRRGVSGSI